MRLERGQQDIVLILVRDLAAKLATPMFLADAEGKIVYYNEAAEQILGRRFKEGASVSPEDWIRLLQPSGLDGTPLRLEEVPPGVALTHQRPDHRQLRIRGLDGVERTVAATGLPLLTSAQHFVGLLAVFWQEADEEGESLR